VGMLASAFWLRSCSALRATAILISIYHMLSRQEVYQDLGYGYLDQRKHKSVTNQLVRRLERLGYQVHLSMEETIPTTPVELAG